MRDDASNGGGTRPLVLVTVGTDAYPFERLIKWVDSWLDGGANSRVHCVVQHGTAPPPQHGDPRPFLAFQDLERFVAEAAVIVAHGGPGTIMLCAERNKKPIVVARLPEYGEVVDRHQVPFVQRLDAEGEIALVDSEHALHATLDRFLADPPAARRERNKRDSASPTVRFEELVSGLFS
jgi:UDP-N-acetylglucosamine transferase subunit ALG13